MVSKPLMDKKDRKLLLEVKNLLEEILETIEVLEDVETMRDIKEAEKDLKAGRTKSFDELLREFK